VKKVLLVLLLLGVAVPASADVFIYAMSDKGITFLEGSPEWEMEKESVKGYVVLETGGDSVNMWAIGTAKFEGKKYAGVESLGSLNALGDGKPAVISDANESRRIFLVGQAKETTINGKKYSVVKKFTGYVIWDYDETAGQRDIGSVQITLSLNTKLTAKWMSLDGEAAKDALMDYLVFEQGYIDATP